MRKRKEIKSPEAHYYEKDRFKYDTYRLMKVINFLLKLD